MQFDETAARIFTYHADIKSKKYPELPNLSILNSTACDVIEAMIYTPVICLIVQGAKEITIGADIIPLCQGDAVLVSHDLPVLSRITSASIERPYMALILRLDLSIIRRLYEQLGMAISADHAAKSIMSGPADPTWLAPLGRYLDLASSPLDNAVLGPSIYREIHYRLMMSPMGGMLRNLLSIDSHASRIGRAILKIRAEYNHPLAVHELAKTAGMSSSSFHVHFKSTTGTTPLQYQKDLRLIAARDLIQNHGQSVSATGFEVGYESPTHFSRDYARKFGIPPSQDRAVRSEMP